MLLNGRIESIVGISRENQKPKLAFEPIQPNGSFGMYFDSDMTGPKIMRSIDYSVTLRDTHCERLIR